MNNATFDPDEIAFLEARDQMSDDELIARMNAVPEMGGELLLELSTFVSKRVPSDGKFSTVSRLCDAAGSQ